MNEAYANTPYAAGKVIVTLRKNFPANGPIYDVSPILDGIEHGRVEVIFSAPSAEAGDILLVHLKDSSTQAVLEAVDALSANPYVLYAEPDHLEELHVLPNDPLYPDLWGLPRIGAPLAWRRTVGSSRIAVGVIDSGVDHFHPDIRQNMWSLPSRRLFNGWNFAENNSDSLDPDGHGTHVAGTIGAVGNNRLGVTGVCWRVSIVSMKFGLDVASAIAAIAFANQFGIPILNASWGGRGYSEALHHAIKHYRGLFIASAGNDGTDNDQDPVYPASYDSPNILSVAASAPDDSLARFSNYGAGSVDIAAPGVGILSLGLANDYTPLNGTSMAAPHVAGAAALLKAYRPRLSPLQLKQLILSTAAPAPQLTGRVLSGGRLDVQALLERARRLPR